MTCDNYSEQMKDYAKSEKRLKLALIIVISLIFGVLIMTTTSALELNNVKEYDHSTKTATLKESKFGEEIASVTLNTPQVFSVGLGYQKVFQYTINSKKNYKDLIQGLKTYEFYSMTETSKVVDLKYQTFFYANITDYQTVCSDTDNLTYFNGCIEKIVGYHQQLTEKWEDLKSFNGMKGQTITIAGFTNVGKGDTVEWVPTLAGEQVKEWAVWKNYLNTNLTFYYSMNETDSTLTNAVGSNNGKIFQPYASLTGHAGIWNASIYFNETLRGQSTAVAGISGNANRTYMAWVKMNSTTDEYLLTTDTSGGGFGSTLKIASGGICLEKFGTSNCTGNVVSTGQWTHIAMTWDGSSAVFYKNGSIQSDTGNIAGGLNNGNGVLSIGTAYANFSYADGLIDEVMVWNRTLNATEINDSMNSSYWSAEGSAPMTINITRPQNTTYTTTSIQLNVTNSTGNASYWNYSLNGGANTTFTPNTTITASQGLNTLRVYANDSLNVVSGDTEYFFVDSLAPNLTIVSPENGQTYTLNNLTLSISSNDTSGLSLTWYNWNSSTNYTYALVGSVNLPTTENWSMEANDGDGFSNNTPTTNLSVSNLTITHQYIGNSNVDIRGRYLVFTDGDGATNSNLYKYWDNGTQIWNKSLGAVYAFGGATICDDPQNNTWIYVGDQNGVAHQFNFTDGNRYAWVDTGASQISKPATCGNGVVAFPSHNNGVWVRNISNINTSIGIADFNSAVLSTPCFSDDGTYFYAGTNDFKLHQRLVSAPNTSDAAVYSATAEIWKTLTCKAGRVAIGTNTQNKVFIFNQTDVTTPLCSATVGGSLHSPPAFDDDGVRWFVGTQGATISAGYVANCSVYQNVSTVGEVTEKITISNNTIIFPTKSAAHTIQELNKTNLSRILSSYTVGSECLGTSFGNGFTYASCFDSKVYKFGNGSDIFSSNSPVINFSTGVNTLNVWSNDTYGNLQYNVSVFTVSAAAPTVNLLSPANNYATNNVSIILVGNTTSELPIVNASFLINALVVSTNTSGINNSNYSYSTTLTDGSYNWAMRVCNNESVCTTSSNRSFTIDTAAPVLAVVSPTGIYNTAQVGNTTFVNWTRTDLSSIDACWYSYNSGTNTSLTCTTNVSLPITFASQNISFYANDTYGNIGSVFANWSYKVYSQSEAYTSTISEGGSSTFYFNFSTNQIGLSTANFTYNGTMYTANITNDGYNYSASKIIYAPEVSVATNLSFFWNITRTDGFVYNSTPHNQTVTPLSIDNCSINSITLFNFSMVDEDTQQWINNATDNTTINIEFLVQNPTTGVTIVNLSQTSANNPYRICSNATLDSTNYTVSGIIQYSSNNRFIEFYNIRNYTLNNATSHQNITLYDLNSSVGTEFKITYKDSGFNTVPGALIQVQRKYVQEAVYKTVELPRIGSSGYAIAKVIAENQLYRLVVVNEGQTVATFDNIVPYCPNPTFSECQININSFGSSTDVQDYSDAGDFQSTMNFNKTSRLATASFTVPSGVPKNVTFLGILFNGRDNQSVCSANTTASSGLLYCSIDSSFDNSSLFLQLIADTSTKQEAVTFLGRTPANQFGGNLIFLGLTFFLFLIGMGVQDDPKTMVPTLFLGIIIMAGLNLVTTQSWIGTGATILWFIVGLIIIMMKGANR